MPALRRSSPGAWVDPADAYRALCGNDTNVVWLDSGPGASTGRSYIGRAARVAVTDPSPVRGVGPVAELAELVEVRSMLEFLRRELAVDRLDSGAPGFSLGWVGWLGYETRFETMGLERPAARSEYPDSAFLLLDEAIEFDHAARVVTLLSLGEPSAPLLSAASAVAVSRDEPSSPTVHGDALSVGPRWRDSDSEYLSMIRECKARIAAGDAYQLCLTTEVRVDVHPDPVETYLSLRRANPSHHGALLRIGEVSLLSSSPEQFLTVGTDGALASRPIKGTRPRGTTADRDAELAAELLASDKERAENLMIVDLMRNDIGRVSRVGSVEVPSLLEVESYATVHQLVSTVVGELEDGLDPVDAVAACFPAGSMTGTPKSSATRILDSLEGHPRGIYSGAFGYFGLDGAVDLAMTIRSIVLSPSGASIGTGGGITALSEPDEELAEVKLKADALLRVLGVRPDRVDDVVIGIREQDQSGDHPDDER